ncbi:lachesin-like [Sarcoptes scabiei]|nr:lachesin-like [Sarcoptes scabiei]
MNHIKEEPIDDEDHCLDQIEQKSDHIIARYDIEVIDNGKTKCFNIAGLSDVLKRNQSCDICIRTDFKELKLLLKNNGKDLMFNTKTTQNNLNKKTFAIKLSDDSRKAFFIPINSTHSLSFLGDFDRNSKQINAQNTIFEDVIKMPFPTRNKHNQLRVEMKTNLYKPLKYLVSNESIKKFFDQLFTTSKPSMMHAAQQTIQDRSSTSKSMTLSKVEYKPIDLINCPHLQLEAITICEIKKIEIFNTQIEVFLRKVQMARFDEIIKIFEFNEDVQKLLSILQRICYLIKGNWVIKSSLLFKFDSIHDSETMQKRFKRMIAIREFLLSIFALEKQIKTAELYDLFVRTDLYQLFEPILLDLTNRSGSNSNIEFILSEDFDFISRYSMIAKKHHEKTREMLHQKSTEAIQLLNLNIKNLQLKMI